MPVKMKTSASQVDLLRSCPRRWYFRYELKLPEEKSKNTILGDIGHGVCERWYPDEELYPEGWHLCRNRWTGELTGDSINKAEQALVQKLVDQAIKDGMLVRLPEGEVEKELKFKCLNFEDYAVTFGGFLDYFSAPAKHIEDHKFCKSFRWYGKKKLENATAMNAYAYAAYVEGWIPKEESVWLRYNLFRKDPKSPKIQPVEVEVDWPKVEAYWEKNILPAIRDMVLYRKNAGSYNDVPVAEDRKNACRAFGKTCDFFDICEGKETPDQHRSRHNGSVIENRKNEYQSLLMGETLKVTKENKMTGFNSMIKNAGRAPVAQPVQAQAPVPQPVQAQAPVTEANRRQMPWYNPACKACADSPVLGMASNGEPCQICDHLQQAMNSGPTSSEFNLTTVDGKVVATSRTAEAAPAVADVVPEPQTVTESVQPLTTPAPAPEPAPVTKAPATPAPAPAKEEEEYNTPVSGMTNIDRASFADMHYKPEACGFSLSFAPVSNRRSRASKKLGEAGHVVRFYEFYEAVTSEIVRVFNAENTSKPVGSFYELNTWARREIIQKNAGVWANMAGNSIIESLVGVEGDARVLLACMESKAQVVFGSPQV